MKVILRSDVSGVGKRGDICDVADGYVVNGWEDSKLENHSGIVDVWRNLKGDPAPLQRANAKLSLVVRLRSSVGHASEWLTPTTQSPTGGVADVGLIGHKVELAGNAVELKDDSASLTYSLAKDAEQAGVVIRDDHGNIVRSIAIDPGAGEHQERTVKRFDRLALLRV